MPAPTKLATAADRLNARIEDVESALRARNYTMPATIQFPDGGGLRFGKHDGSWRLLYVRGGPAPTYLPLTSAPRRVRVAAMTALPALLAALEQAEEVGEAEVEEAIQRGDRFLDTLRKGLP